MTECRNERKECEFHNPFGSAQNLNCNKKWIVFLFYAYHKNCSGLKFILRGETNSPCPRVFYVEDCVRRPTSCHIVTCLFGRWSANQNIRCQLIAWWRHSLYSLLFLFSPIRGDYVSHWISYWLLNAPQRASGSNSRPEKPYLNTVNLSKVQMTGL